MIDQAAELRARAAARVAAPAPGPNATVPAIVVGSGKGGVGKSTCSVLLAAALARRGRRTLLVDGSLNQGNLHILFGAGRAARLASVVTGEARPADLVVPVAERLWLLPADSGAECLHALPALDRARLQLRLCGLYDHFDAVVVDGGGAEDVVRTATLRATRLVAVAVPEPASLSDAYALIKLVHLQVPTLPVGVFVNRVQDPAEAEWVRSGLALATRRFLDLPLEDLGAMDEDPAIRSAFRAAGGLLAPTPAAIEALAARLVPR